MKRIIERWYNIFGYEVYIRLEPDEFKKDLKHLANLIDDRKYEEFNVAIEQAYSRWGSDRELIRVGTYAEFMSDDIDDVTENK